MGFCHQKVFIVSSLDVFALNALSHIFSSEAIWFFYIYDFILTAVAFNSFISCTLVVAFGVVFLILTHFIHVYAIWFWIFFLNSFITVACALAQFYVSSIYFHSFCFFFFIRFQLLMHTVQIIPYNLGERKQWDKLILSGTD